MEDAKLLLCCGYHVEKTLNVNLYYNYYYSVLGLYTLCYIVVSYLEASALLASLPLRKKALENGLLSNQGRGPTLSSFYVVNKNIHYAFTYTYRFFWKYITRALLASFRILRLTYLFFLKENKYKNRVRSDAKNLHHCKVAKN